MTLSEAINLVDASLHNTCTQEEKIRWLSTLEGLAQVLLFGAGATFDGYDSAHLDAALKIPVPFCEVYLFWLEAKIHYQNGDFTRFNNANAMFRTAWQRYAAFVHRSSAKAVENRFF